MSDQIIPPRRNFLIRALGLTAGAAKTVAAAPIVAPKHEKPPASKGHFKTPLEYFLAMQAIGWTPRAMFQVRRDGSIHCMGSTRLPRKNWPTTWHQFHAIQVRTPVQLGPGEGGEWWKAVWQFLYDRGLREDVTRCPSTPA